MPILVETAYLPPVCYMAEVLATDAVTIEAFETYQKQTYRNHCDIYGPNGKQVLSIPVIKVYGNHTLTKEIRISDHQPWQRVHWRSIETAYNNSPFFLFYLDLIAPIYEKKFNFLIDLNLEILYLILKILKVNKHITLTSSYQKSTEIISGMEDPGMRDNGEENPDQPMNQLMQEATPISDLRGSFIQKNSDNLSGYPRYAQVFEPRHGFLSGLSIIDVIFNLGPETNEYLSSIKGNQH